MPRLLQLWLQGGHAFALDNHSAEEILNWLEEDDDNWRQILAVLRLRRDAASKYA